MAKLRFSGKHVFLTYPQCGMDLQVIYDLLNTKLRNDHNGIKNFIIAHEDHKDGTPHRHVWLELVRAPDRVEKNFFDLDSFHGNYQSIKFVDNCAKYCIKGGVYITSYSEKQLEEMIERANDRSSRKVDKCEVAKDLMFRGRTIKDVVTEHPALLFGLSKLKDDLLIWKQMDQCTSVLPNLENEWIFGETGSGKSKYARETYPLAFTKSKDLFWCSYEFQDVVLIEDIDETWEDVVWELKIWADHYPFAGRIKHKPSITIRPKKIVITSNYTIAELMERIYKRKNIKMDYELIKALERRFKVRRLDKPSVLPPVFPDNYWYSNEVLNSGNNEMEITYDKY